MGVELCPLYESEILNFYFDFDEWPGTHTETEKVMRPFNGSIFSLRKHYN